VCILGYELGNLNRSTVEDEAPSIFWGDNFTDTRKEAAYELFELYYPDEYRVWEGTLCDGLIFDIDRFLDSPGFNVEEIKMKDKVALLVTLQ
jgi:hypothetical protein